MPLTRHAVRDPGAAAGRASGGVIADINCGLILIVIHGSGCDFGRGNQQVFQRQFQLLDLALDLLRGLAEDLLLQLGDAQPQGLDQRIMGAQRG